MVELSFVAQETILTKGMTLEERLYFARSERNIGIFQDVTFKEHTCILDTVWLLQPYPNSSLLFYAKQDL